MNKKKILLYGIGTYKNRGIEAILQSTINQIDKTKYDIEVATFDYNYNKKYYNKDITKYINHYKRPNELNAKEKKLEEKYKNMPFDFNNFEKLYQSAVVQEMENVDICFSAGGDNYCYGGCNWLYTLDSLSNKTNKKTVLWGASLFEKIDNPLLINDLQNFDVLVIRESMTYNEVKKYVPEKRIILVSDPAFALEKKRVKLDPWYEKNKYIVLNLSPLTITSEEQNSEIVSFIDYILTKTEYSICLLPHVTNDESNDLNILNSIKDKYPNEKRIYLEDNNYNCNELKYIISKSSFAVVARTHASIAAYSTNVPTLVIGYSVKSKGIAKDIFGEYENYVIAKDDLKEGKLLEKFKYIESNEQKIKKILKEKMPNYIEQSKHIFDTVIDRLTELSKEEICNRSKCIGCGICSKKCPKNAIEMVEDEHGFIRPKINLDLCINCDICRRNCPINNSNLINNKKTFKSEYYAAKSRNNEIKKQSSSGGIFSVLAEATLKNNGVVYGCEMNNFKLNHVRIDNVNDLSRIRGSKYYQSNIINIFEQVKEDLEKGILVLFSGTPCNIGSLTSFLGKDYKNLITVSVICHGVTNEKILLKQISEIEKQENKKITNINFRSKDNGWTLASIEYDFDNSKLVNLFINDNFMNLYLKNIILRESCYNCSYKGDNNKADIILGDYWGIEVTNNKFFDESGVSFLIINSSNGKRFISDNEIFNKIDYTNGRYEDIVKYNYLLFESVKMPDERFDYMYKMKYCDLKYLNLLLEMKKSKQKINELMDENSRLFSNIEDLNSKVLEEDKLKQNIDDLKNENNELLKNIEVSSDEKLQLQQKNEKLNEELWSIRNSKRFKFIDKIGNIKNKLRGR